MDDQLLNDNVREIKFQADHAVWKLERGIDCAEEISIISDCIKELSK